MILINGICVMSQFRFIFAFLILWAAAGVLNTDHARAQQQPVQDDRLPVQFSVDHAVFSYAGDEALVELYLAFDATSLTFTDEGDHFSVRLPLDLSAVPASDQVLSGTPVDPVWSDSLYLRFPIADTSGIAPGQHFLHQIRFTVPPGEYELRAAIPQSQSGNRQEIEVRMDLIVPNYSAADTPLLSGVTLASSIRQSDQTDSPFYKHGLTVRPNANKLYGQGLSSLYYYAEAYGTEALANADDEYTLYAFVAEANGAQAIDTLQQRTQRQARSPDVLVGSFDVGGLPSGSYFLHLALLNEANEAVDEQSRKFFVYNPDVEREQISQASITYEQSPYASMPEEEVTLALEQIQPIATSQEQRTISDLETLETKRRFLLRFWDKRDPEPSTVVNEYKMRYDQLVNFAGDRYGNNYERGWESDRGRVMLKFGRPDNIESHLYERDMLPYEIWQYNNISGEGQSMFVFADREGFGNFELLHSSVTGEQKRPNWREYLMQN